MYLVAESESDEHTEKLLAKSCARIFEEQLDGWYLAPESWPEDRGIRNFRQWFSYTVHSMIVDVCDDPPVAEEVDDEPPRSPVVLPEGLCRYSVVGQIHKIQQIGAPKSLILLRRTW